MRAGTSLVLIAAFGCSDQSDDEVARMLETSSAWIAAARAERCPRPALRSPVTEDASALLLGLRDRSSPEGQCLQRAFELECRPKKPCTSQTLESLEPRPEIVAACEPLYDKISRVAHATEACSPMNLDADIDAMDAPIFALDHAVRIRIAPLVRRGEIGAAAAHVIDALRFSDDYARKATLIGPMTSLAMTRRLVATLEEILANPKLTPDDVRVIARDLDVLLASPPAFDAIARQEHAWAAKHDKMTVSEFSELEQRAHTFQRACNEALRSCAEQLAKTKFQGIDFSLYPRQFGERDFLLTVARMQAELRMVDLDVCKDPTRRRLALAKWLTSDRALLADGDQPVVSPPSWQYIKDQRSNSPPVLRCVAATH